jgi:hypothetical protein
VTSGRCSCIYLCPSGGTGRCKNAP